MDTLEIKNCSYFTHHIKEDGLKLVQAIVLYYMLHSMVNATTYGFTVFLHEKAYWTKMKITDIAESLSLNEFQTRSIINLLLKKGYFQRKRLNPHKHDRTFSYAYTERLEMEAKAIILPY